MAWSGKCSVPGNKRSRKPANRMNYPPPSWLWLMKALLAAALCWGTCPGQDAPQKPKPPAQKSMPVAKLLNYRATAKKIQELSKLPVKGCTSSHLTLKGLVRLANDHLQKAGRIERVIIEDPALDVDVEKDLKANFFSPLYQSKEPLDREDLVSQINSGSLAGLLMNLPALCGVGLGCFEDSFLVTMSWTQDLSAVGFNNAYELRAMKARP